MSYVYDTRVQSASAMAVQSGAEVAGSIPKELAEAGAGDAVGVCTPPSTREHVWALPPGRDPSLL